MEALVKAVAERLSAKDAIKAAVEKLEQQNQERLERDQQKQAEYERKSEQAQERLDDALRQLQEGREQVGCSPSEPGSCIGQHERLQQQLQELQSGNESVRVGP